MAQLFGTDGLRFSRDDCEEDLSNDESRGVGKTVAIQPEPCKNPRLGQTPKPPNFKKMET
eukprot:1721307-Amphidinium_carterae.1